MNATICHTDAREWRSLFLCEIRYRVTLHPTEGAWKRTSTAKDLPGASAVSPTVWHLSGLLRHRLNLFLPKFTPLCLLSPHARAVWARQGDSQMTNGSRPRSRTLFLRNQHPYRYYCVAPCPHIYTDSLTRFDSRRSPVARSRRLCTCGGAC